VALFFSLVGGMSAQVDAQAPLGPSTAELRRRSIAVVPFYGGVATVQLDPRSGKVLNETLPAGAGNSHTLATAPLKLLQLSATVASSLRFFGTVVVGVVSQAEARLVRQGLAAHLPPRLHHSSVLRVQIVPCGTMSVYLPYRLLQWMQRAHKAGGLLPPGGDEAHQDENVAEVPRLSALEQRRRRLRVARPTHGSSAATAETTGRPPALPPPPPRAARRLASVLGLKGPHHGHKGSGSDGEPDSASGASAANRMGGAALLRQGFDLVYYSEADNVLVELNREATARALLGFAAAPDLGGRSYVAPNRLEGELHAYRPDAAHAEVVAHLKPVGQNNCEDDRGDLEAFGPGGTRATTKGTPN
jgi:hypothetical protein